jgi:pSer/pThr/pTyr-binding forkhead associated (FHA) protein
MVPEAVVVALRIVVLVLLWGFVLAAVVAVRHDIFGGRRMTPAAPRPAPAAPVATPPRRSTPPPAPASAAPAHLVVVDGPKAGTSLSLAGGSITIGRSPDSTLVLDDDFASTHHARLTPRGDGWIVEDVGSTNGTFVGRSRVRDAVEVGVGTPIRVGRTVLELRP